MMLMMYLSNMDNNADDDDDDDDAGDNVGSYSFTASEVDSMFVIVLILL
jgi:hypothetical protein